MANYQRKSSREIYQGRVFGLRADDVEMPDGRVAVREVVVHPGAVVIAALDDADRIVMIRQYRHPVSRYLWELPAGLLDIDGEDPWAAAQRELYEEAHLRASDWQALADLYTSPGLSNEALRVYVAKGLTEVAASDRFADAQDEELDVTVARVPISEAVSRVLAGDISNAPTAAGILAVDAARQRGWADLRPADVSWPAREGLF